MRVDDPSANDIRDTLGLVLNIAAVIAFVLCLNGFSTGNPGAAALVGTAAAAAFLASLLCFAGEHPAVETEVGPSAATVTSSATSGGYRFDRTARTAQREKCPVRSTRGG